MNRLEIVVKLIARHWPEESFHKRNLLVISAFDMADDLIKSHEHRNKASEVAEENKITITTYDIDDVVASLVDNKLDWLAPKNDWQWCQASEIAKWCFQEENPSNFSSARIGVYVRSRNGNKSKRVTGRKLLHTPPFK